MPTRCVVPGCKSNIFSRGPNVSSFGFPKDLDLRNEWLKRIPLINFKVTLNTRVCAKHFRPSDIITVDSVRRDDGTILTVPRQKFRLCPGAFPTSFENHPSLPEEKVHIKLEHEAENNGYHSWTKDFATNDVLTDGRPHAENVDLCGQDRGKRKTEMVFMRDGVPVTEDSNTKARCDEDFIQNSNQNIITDRQSESKEMVQNGISHVRSSIESQLIDSSAIDHTLEGNVQAVLKQSLNKLYKCDSCSLEFTTLYHLKQHKRSHTGEKLSDDYAAAFIEEWRLKIHRRLQKGEKHKCDVCAAAFKDSRTLKIHKRSHTGEKPYQCDDCGVAFARSDYLRLHKIVHTEERPYQCEICGATFKRIGHMKYHKRSHSKDKQHGSDNCEAAFTDSVALKIDNRRHTGEKPYKCDICKAAFKSSSCLSRHKKIYTGQRPYKCDVCGAAFKRKSHVVTHKKSHTKEKPYTVISVE